jgi:hypothetical protein
MIKKYKKYKKERRSAGGQVIKQRLAAPFSKKTKEKFTYIHANLGSGSSHAPAIATDERGSFSPSFCYIILDLIYTKV